MNACLVSTFYFRNSLLKPEKYAARRSHKENQGISTITTERNANNQSHSGSIRRGGGADGNTGVAVKSGVMSTGNTQHSPHGMPRNYYERDQRHTQVKTYTDQGNGFNQRSGSTTLYSKVGKLCNKIKKFSSNNNIAFYFLFLYFFEIYSIY